MCPTCGNGGTFHDPIYSDYSYTQNLRPPTFNTGYGSSSRYTRGAPSDGSTDSGYGTRTPSVASPAPQPSYPAQIYPVQNSPYQNYSDQGYSTQIYFSNCQLSQQSPTYPYNDARSPSIEAVQNAPVSSSKHKKERSLSPTSLSSPSDFPCLHPHCGHISFQAHDLERHMAVHFPPKEDELLDCKYEWCGRTGAHGFKREDHRKEHYRKLHLKGSESPKTRKDGKMKRSRRKPEESPKPGPPERRNGPAASKTQTAIITENEIRPKKAKTMKWELAARKEQVLPPLNVQIPTLSTATLAGLGNLQLPQHYGTSEQDFSQTSQHPDIFSTAFDPFSGYSANANTGTISIQSPQAPGLIFCQLPPSTNVPSHRSGESSSDLFPVQHRAEYYTPQFKVEDGSEWYPSPRNDQFLHRSLTPQGVPNYSTGVSSVNGPSDASYRNQPSDNTTGYGNELTLHRSWTDSQDSEPRLPVPNPDIVMSEAFGTNLIESLDWTAITPDNTKLDSQKPSSMSPSLLNILRPSVGEDSVHQEQRSAILCGPIACAKHKGKRPGEAVLGGFLTPIASCESTEDPLADMRSQVLRGLLTNETNQYCASLKVQWDVMAFMRGQFSDNDFPNTALGTVVTISGCAQQAQASTCLEYIRQTWPAHGSEVLNVVQDALDSVTHTSKSCFENGVVNGGVSDGNALSRYTDLEIDFTHEFFFLNIKSEAPDIVVDVFQQVAWMGAALRTSRDGRVQYCVPKLEMIPRKQETELALLNVTFDMTSPDEEDRSCWFPLFTNPVIAYGFPTAPRNDNAVGLEIPLDMMAVLGGARHVVDFEGGLVMKGHSAMFVPLKRYDQYIQWHLIRRSDEHRILYRELSNECPNRAMLQEVDHEALLNTRAFLGWWPSSEIHLGTADAAYNSIDWSPAGDAKRTTKFSSASIGFQTMVTGQLSFAPGAKDGRLHFSQKGPFQKLVQSAQKMPVLLYDPTDRRAWCVPGLELMLHIVQTRHHLSPYNIEGEEVELTPVKPENGRGAAIEAVIANQMRLLYAQNIASEKAHSFQDEILDIWSRMERLMEEKDSLEASPGFTLHGTMQSKLHGWEYMSLVNEKNYKRKEAKVAKSSGGWVDLFNDIDALVLFATGFDDIIKPVSNLDNLCRHWRTLPKGKDYLAVGVPILEMLYTEAGSHLSRKHLSTSHHQWHRGSVLFEHCSDTTSCRCECDRTQQIYHESFKTFGHVQPPGSLEENGCVIFGQAHHPFKPPQTTARSQNTIRSLFNLSNRSSRSTMQSSGSQKYSTLPTPPSSVSPESGENRDDTTWSQEKPPSPVSFTDGVVQETQPVRRCSTPLNQMPNFEKRKRLDSGGDRDDYASSTLEYRSTLGHVEISKGQSLGCTATAGGSKAGCIPLDGRNTIRHKAKTEDFNDRSSLSLATCYSMDVDPLGSLERVETINRTQRNVK